VERTREVYRRKRELLIPVLEAKGYRIAASEATMYLWVHVEEAAGDVAARLLEHGLVVSPGPFFGPSGEGYIRFALVPTEDECRRAATILEEVL
jgi:aspartate/methionine/tyrosine aminotransferase